MNFVSVSVDKICVKFLADNGRLSRLTRDRIIAYEGLTQFQQYAEEMRHKVSEFKATFAVKCRLKTATTESKNGTSDK